LQTADSNRGDRCGVIKGIIFIKENHSSDRCHSHFFLYSSVENSKETFMSVETIYQTYLQQLSWQERLELIQLLVDETIPAVVQRETEQAAASGEKRLTALQLSGKDFIFNREEANER
jgi:hypothetical protein